MERLVEAFVAATVLQLEQDMQIWENERYGVRPLLIEVEAGIWQLSKGARRSCRS